MTDLEWRYFIKHLYVNSCLEEPYKSVMAAQQNVHMILLAQFDAKR